VERSRDWWTQAQADLAHAKAAVAVRHFDWACFAAHQAAEKALKAVFERRGEKAAGHSVRYLLAAVTEGEVPPQVLSAAKALDKHDIPTRYPNGLAQGAPTECYTEEEASDAIRRAEEVLRFCDRLLAR
jgi:HEPN domain-containing protein